MMAKHMYILLLLHQNGILIATCVDVVQVSCSMQVVQKKMHCCSTHHQVDNQAGTDPGHGLYSTSSSTSKPATQHHPLQVCLLL